MPKPVFLIFLKTGFGKIKTNQNRFSYSFSHFPQNRFRMNQKSVLGKLKGLKTGLAEICILISIVFVNEIKSVVSLRMCERNF